MGTLSRYLDYELSLPVDSFHYRLSCCYNVDNNIMEQDENQINRFVVQ
jgi:hypothetical protein